MTLSLTTAPFLSTLAVLMGLMAIATIRGRRRRLRRVVLALATVVAGAVFSAAVVNAYFDYYPSVATLLGRSARDQATRHQLLQRLARISLARRRSPAAPSSPKTMPTAARVETVDRRDTDPPAQPPRGLVETVAIPGNVSGFRARPAEVYLPPAWFAAPRPQLPVIELLHGMPGSPDDWTRAGSADLIADHYAATHSGMAPIIVMPDVNGSFTADSECVDTPNRRAETYLAVDVPAYVTSELGAATAARSWAVAGASEGGYCAMVLSLRHPDRWATFADFAGLDQPTYPGGALRHLFGGSLSAYRQHLPSYLLRPGAIHPAVAGWFAGGTADGGTNRSLLLSAAMARQAGLETHVLEQRGAHHTWRFFRRALSDSFAWMADRIGAGGPPRRAI